MKVIEVLLEAAQKAFLRNIRRQADEKNQKVFLLTHHLPTNLAGTDFNSLWSDSSTKKVTWRLRSPLDVQPIK